MSETILEKDNNKPLQADRTRRGVCARCGVDAHDKQGNCLDGGGSFTWCHSREEMGTIIGKLEGILAEAKRPRP